MSVVKTGESAIVQIHAVPQALLSRVERALSDVLRRDLKIAWLPLPGHLLQSLGQRAAPMFSGQLELSPNSDSNANMASNIVSNIVSDIASELASLRTIWFEVSSMPFESELGQRYCFTPVLGLFHSQIDKAGNQVFGENQLISLLGLSRPNPELKASQSANALQEKLTDLLGLQWDAQLEPLRAANLEFYYRTELAS